MLVKTWMRGSLKNTMVALVSLPLLVAAVLSGLVAWQQWQQLTATKLIQERTAFLSAVSSLVHEQQLERGATSVFINSQGKEFTSKLAAQRQKTDAAMQAFRTTLEKTKMHQGSGIEGILKNILSGLDRRQAHRAAVDSLEMPLSKALGHYTQINGQALASVLKIATNAGSAELQQLILTLHSLMYAKEFAGIERAVGSGGFAAGEIALARGLRLKALIARQEAGLQNFLDAATDGNEAALRAVLDGRAAQELERLRSIAFDAIASGDLQGTTAAQFFAASSDRISGFKRLEEKMLLEVSETASSRVAQAIWWLSLVALLCLGTSAFCIALAWYSIKQMLRSVQAISYASELLARGDSDAKLPEDSPVELDQIVWSINSFHKSVIEAKERDAENVRQREERDAEDRARERDLAEEKRAQEEQEQRAAIKRQEMVERLKDGIKIVVDHAVNGDFSQRVDTDFSDRELSTLAENVNELVQSVDHGVTATGEALQRVADGDLTELMQGAFKGAFKDLQNNTNAMIEELKSLMSGISSSTDNLSLSSAELRDTSDVLSKRTEQNAMSLQETSAALEQLSASIKQVDANVSDANDNAKVASDTANKGRSVASEAAEAMTRINDASCEITKVVSVINDISFQINLLALNAGVEAARAGEAGRGFSVVASEVRSLAQRASEASNEIARVIAKSDGAVAEGVQKVSIAEESLVSISDSVIDVSTSVQEVAHAISEQVSGLADINVAMGQIDQNTQKQVATFEEVTAASVVLSNEAEGLKRASKRFDTDARILPISKPKAAQPTLAPTSLQNQPAAPAKAVVNGGIVASTSDGWGDV